MCMLCNSQLTPIVLGSGYMSQTPPGKSKPATRITYSTLLRVYVQLPYRPFVSGLPPTPRPPANLPGHATQMAYPMYTWLRADQKGILSVDERCGDGGHRYICKITSDCFCWYCGDLSRGDRYTGRLLPDIATLYCYPTWWLRCFALSSSWPNKNTLQPLPGALVSTCDKLCSQVLFHAP
ncbi:hypothetical protein BD777DRAFT_162717 [Yarrowia lipolytica]|uniref:Uncharacterized protein n=1 Tax=Yarrowia lipolytica TaxID=4952 RepID=A0A1D8N9N3_YARLL|nr:hypothetical protein YALI1_C06118g [Yarrowia lipolytica]RMI95886.1 hypothetical protein BD777DRAFT_162717 [Yarrowia lipolytica]